MPESKQTGNKGKLLFTQVHLTLIIFSLISWYLTRDYRTVLQFLLIAEIWYWWYCWLNFKGWLAFPDRIIAKLPSLRNVEWQPVLSWLLLAIGILWLVVGAARVAFGEHAFGTAERWEVGALTWNVVFSLLSYVLMPQFQEVWAQKLFPLCILGGGLLLTYLAISKLAQGRPWPHFVLVLAIALCYLSASFVAYKSFPKKRARYIKMVLYADLPTVIALAVLGFVVRVFFHLEEQMSIFLSGVIAFQFISCSLVSALIEGGMDEAILKPATALAPDANDASGPLAGATAPLHATIDTLASAASGTEL